MILQPELLKSLKTHANNVAIEEAGRKISYEELLIGANKVTNYLLGKKIEAGTIVGVHLDAISDIASAIIGIINARCVFVLIDGKIPDIRLCGMLEELNPGCLLVDSLNNHGALSKVEQCLFENIQADKRSEVITYPEFNEDDSVYIYFTSGSTGKPKGIVGKNNSLIQFLNWEVVTFSITESMRMSQLVSPYFDAFLRDLFVPLLSGATVCIPPREEDFLTFNKLSNWLEDNRINFIHCVPSVFRVLNNMSLTEQNLQSLQCVLMSGEKIIPSELKKWYEIFRDRIRLFNLYGTTETTMVRCVYEIKPADISKARMPIGEPIDGTEILIADRDLNPCAPLITGDLYIVTEYATKGYLNDEQLTEEKFIRLNKDIPYRVAFRTGDKARRLADGTIDLLGREDRQVKLRGIRIELEEVEIVLAQAPQVRNIVVVLHSGEDALYAYIIPEQPIIDDVLWEEEMISYGRQHLPGVMMPSKYFIVTEYPLLPNGKVDYRSLIDHKKKNTITKSTNEMEAKILGIWKTILGDKEISTDESFHNAGGTSLSIMRLIAKIFSEFNVRVTLSELFNNLTIQKQAILVKDKIVELHLSQMPDITTQSGKDLSPIKKINRKEYYQTSSIQKGLYFLHKRNSKSTSYNFPSVMILSGVVDTAKVNYTLLKLIDRHQSLRTAFELVEGEPMQRVMDKVDFSLDYLEISEDEIESAIVDFVKPFDLTKAPLIRVGLAKINEEKNLLIVDMPHIISDHMTRGILVRDFKSIYNNEYLPDLSIDYIDFAEWQQGEENRNAQLQDREYWMRQFEDTPAVLELPLDFLRPPVFSFAGDTIFFEIENDLIRKLGIIAEKESTSKFVVFLSIYFVLLHRLTNQEDIIIGTSTLGRKFPVLDHVVGVFINTLGIRTKPNGKSSFKHFLQEVKQRTHTALDHQDYPFSDLVSSLDLQRDPSRNPLFDVMFEYHTDVYGDNEMSDLHVTPYKKNNMKESKFDLSLHIQESNDEVSCSFTYSKDLFRQATILRFINYFKELMASIVKDMDVSISGLKILPENEEILLTQTFNNTTSTYPEDCTIVSLFEEQVSRFPDKPAVAFNGKTLTYSELDYRVSNLAQYLSLNGVNTGSVVGLMVDRSIEMVIGMLGIIKAGGGYLPIDPTLPEKRIALMMEQSNMMLLLTQDRYNEKYAAYLPVKDINFISQHEYNNDMVVDVQPKDLAYCIFTSGSTGRPKGVMMGHKGVVNLIKGLEETIYSHYGGRSLRVSLLASYAFDASVQQIFGALLLGHCLFIADEDERKDGTRLIAFFNRNDIDVSDGTPTHLRILTDSFKSETRLKSLSTWIIAGETMPVKGAREFLVKTKGDVRLFNLYGPTETCVDSTYYQVRKDNLDDYATIPIGRPMPNERIYITDTFGNVVPIGVVGELCIAGDGLADRYVGDEFMTSQKFDSDWVANEQMVYHTGDMARWLPDGNIEYKGRVDNQIKLRGYRIELGEIEHQLNAHEKIRGTIVLACENDNEPYLVAYYMSDVKLSVRELRNYLIEKLPDYMIPSFFVHLTEFPLTLSGKVDIKLLPNHEIEEEDYYETPLGEIEGNLAGIWSEILNIDKDKIGRESSFFELGGHSLRAVYLASRIHKEFDIEVTLEDIFKCQTLSKIADQIQGSNNLAYSNIPPAAIKGHYPMTSSQHRLYFLYEFEKESIAYNLPHVIRLKGGLDINKLEIAFNKLVDRHESLRTSFNVVGDEVVQKVHNDVKITISHFESDLLSVSSVIRQFIRPFDLSKSPLFRVCLIKIASDDHVLVVDIHHIVTDGISQGILIKDFSALYSDRELSTSFLQYKDYAEWQNSPDQQEKLKSQQQFWIDEFQNDVSKLELPCDYERPLVKNYSGSSVQFVLDQDTTESLKKLGEKVGATSFMTILSVFNVLLSKLSGQQDIVIGVSTAGREAHPDLYNTVGMFVNTLPLRNTANPELSFPQFLEKVKSKTLHCFANQSYQYEKLIDELNIPRDTNRNPLFDVLFFFQNFDEQLLEVQGITVEPYRYSKNITKFDLTLSAIEENNQLQFKLDYSTELFNETTIKRFVAYFQEIAKSVVSNPSCPLSEINILPDEEREQQLLRFNNTEVSYPADKTIIDLFKEQVHYFPDNNAVVVSGQKLSFSELDRLSDILAAEIQNAQNDSKCPVAILIDPSVEMIIAIIAVLKSGNYFLPLDHEQENNRYKKILKDSGSHLLVTRQNLPVKVEFNGQTILVDHAELGRKQTKKLIANVNPNDLAYVIYTSGSTGTPKGVKISHHNLVNYVFWIKDFAQISSADKSVLLSSYAFDLGYTVLFPTLLSGAELHLVTKGLYQSPEKLLDYIKNAQITYLKLTPSLCSTLTIPQNFSEGTLSSMRYIILGGERAKPTDIEAIYKHYKNVVIINHYGPTETTIGCIARYIPFESFNEFNERPTIGKPIANTKCYILDSRNNLLPLGSKGELCIGGKGVGQGYLGDTKLSKMKFIDNPFESGGKLYRTGDWARWKQNGEIEFLGRTDDQVKINGYRLSTNEIEKHLLSNVSVSEAVVLAKENTGEDTCLVAYCVCSTGINQEELRQYLSARMPDYMLPSFFVFLDKMPLTSNGKLDRRFLSGLTTELQKEYTPASNTVEEKLVEIWSEILKRDVLTISVHAGFFELGGNSLKAIFILNTIKKEFKAEIKVFELFQKQTIYNIAKVIQNTRHFTHHVIPEAYEKEYYPTTSAQQRLFFLHEFDKNSKAYNLPRVIELKGDLEIDKLEKVFRSLVLRHESLRTSFLMNNQEILQKIASDIEFNIEYFDSSNTDIQLLIDKFIRPFDLQIAPLIRVGLVKVSDSSHLLMTDIHHIITDGVSQKILINDFVSLYNNEPIKEISLRYRDYAEWMQGEGQQENKASYEEFWKKEFSKELTLLELPTDYTRPIVKSYLGNTLSFEISKEDTSKLKLLGEIEGTTMFVTALSLFYVLLSKLSSQEDITIGTPVTGRKNAELQDVVGMFVNTIVLRNYPNGNLSYRDFLKIVKEKVLYCLDNESYQYEELIKELRLGPDTSRNPLFDAMFAFKDIEDEIPKLKGLTVSPYKSGHNLSKFDIMLTATELNGQLFLDLEYSADLFKRETIERFIHCYRRIIKEVIESPDKKISQINIISNSEFQQLEHVFNASAVHYPSEKTIVDIFEEQVKKRPENVAVWYGDRTMSYRQLKEKSDKVATYLKQEHGVKTGDLVGLLLDREEELLPSIFGILKSGAAYVPLSTAHPPARIRSIISNAGLKALITRKQYIDTLSIEMDSGLIDLDVSIEKIDTSKSEQQLVEWPNGRDLAYVIYTSGSTGLPKGVMVEHHSVVNLLLWMQREYNLTEEDVLLQKTPLIFDVSVYELFGWSLTGAGVCLLPSYEERNPEKIIDAIKQHKVTIVQFVPSMLDAFLDEVKDNHLDSLRYVLSAGEPLSAHHVNKFKSILHDKYKTQLANIYGPTESTVYSSYYNCDFAKEYGSHIPIGKPIDNVKLYVIDKYGRYSPIGVPGELYIGGVGLAKGYINDIQLTNEKFVSHPFKTGELLYRTGDLAKWGPDGDIIFLGRVDYQVKIRGVRIELGEIEQLLIEHNEIHEATVITRDVNENKCMVAYYVADKEVVVRELKEQLSRKLPEYMLPSYYIHLRSMPRTHSGKIDRNALPYPDFKADSFYVAPTTDIEKKLTSIWSRVLRINEEIISVNSSFFELGGHSLKAIQIVNSIGVEFQIEIKLVDLFHKPTIIQQAEIIELELWVKAGGKALEGNQRKVIDI